MFDKEVMPDWLSNYSPESNFDAESFFASRVVYYPGSGLDGSIVAFFGRRHLAHYYVYADYGLTREYLEGAIRSPGFRGYESLGTQGLRVEDLRVGAIEYHLSAPEMREGNERRTQKSGLAGVPPYGFLAVFQRKSGFDDDHGPTRFACLFLYADGHAAYDALFCQPNQNAPFAVAIQDHAFGGNYSDFGRGGLMNRIADRTHRWPELLLCSANDRVWDHYRLVPGEVAEHGGAHGHARRLYFRNTK